MGSPGHAGTRTATRLPLEPDGGRTAPLFFHTTLLPTPTPPTPPHPGSGSGNALGTQLSLWETVRERRCPWQAPAWRELRAPPCPLRAPTRAMPGLSPGGESSPGPTSGLGFQKARAAPHQQDAASGRKSGQDSEAGAAGAGK